MPFVSGWDSLPLIAPDEGRNAEVAREMKESGAWLVPTYNGVDYLDKPAFYFKAVALSLAAFGDNETAARLPSAAFGMALVALVFAFCRKVHGTRCGLLAVIVVATTPLFVMNARTVIFDIALAFFVCGAIFAGYLAEEAEGRARRNWYLLGAASAGLATLVKGPVGFLIPALVLLVFNRVEGRRGVVAAVAVAAEPAGVLRHHAAVVCGALPRAPGLSPIRAGGGILPPVHHGENLSSFRAVLFLSAHRRRDVFPVEPAAAGGGPGDVAGTLGEESRRPAVPHLVGGGGGVFLHLPVKAAGLHPERDGGLPASSWRGCSMRRWRTRMAGPPVWWAARRRRLPSFVCCWRWRQQ